VRRITRSFGCQGPGRVRAATSSADQWIAAWRPLRPFSRRVARERRRVAFGETGAYPHPIDVALVRFSNRAAIERTQAAHAGHEARYVPPSAERSDLGIDGSHRHRSSRVAAETELPPRFVAGGTFAAAEARAHADERPTSA